MPTEKNSTNTPRTNLRQLLLAAVGLVTLGLTLSACPTTYPDCDNDKGCASHGEVCVANHCRQCRDDSQCTRLDACMTCQANECVKVPGCCKSDLDCPDGRCKDARCVAQCEVNSDCPDGERCLNGKCMAGDGSCTSDSQCPDGLRCKEGVCTTRCEVKPILFDFNEYTIRLDQETPLQDNASCLKESGDKVTMVTVEGHTDERGADEYNLTLGQRRANSVAKQYRVLGVKGVGPTLSFGEEKPVCSGSGERCWRQNRRAETKVR